LGMITLAGAFAWPMSIYIGALLLVFPREDLRDNQIVPARPRWNLLAASVLTIVAWIGIKAVIRHDPEQPATLVDPMFLTPIRAVLNLSLAVSLAYLFLGAVCLLDCKLLFAVRSYVAWRSIGAGLVVLVGFLAIQHVQGCWAAAPC